MFLGFEDLTAVVKKSSIFGVITLCTSLKFNRHFGETSCLNLQGLGKKPDRAVLVTCFMPVSTLKMAVTYFSEISGLCEAIS